MLVSQGRSITSYVANEDVANIFVIINDEQSVAIEVDKLWWGEHRRKVKILTRDQISCPPYGTGWDSQQLCKLVTASISKEDYVLILDAKTWFVKPFVKTDIFPGDNKINVVLQGIQPVFQSGWDYLINEFGIEDPKKQPGPSGVPYIMKPASVRELFKYIENKHNRSFRDWYREYSLTPTFITEFLLYASWIYFNEGYDQYTGEQPWEPVNIARSEGKLFNEKLKLMNNTNTLTASIHADVKLSAKRKKEWNSFLIEKHLLKR
jgi:hypothetical protein